MGLPDINRYLDRWGIEDQISGDFVGNQKKDACGLPSVYIYLPWISGAWARQEVKK